MEGSRNITCLHSIINQLPGQHREMLLLCLGGNNACMIARILGISEKAARFRRKRACYYLRKHVDDTLVIAVVLWLCNE